MSAGSRLPEKIDPWRLGARGVELDGELDLAGLTRFRDLVSGCAEMARVRLRFGQDAERRILVNCRIEATAMVECQRCLQSMDVALQTDSELAVVSSDEAAGSLPQSLDPVVVEHGTLSIADLVEDELILALPLAPMHQTGPCAEAAESGESEQRGDGENPFSVLKGLKREP